MDIIGARLNLCLRDYDEIDNLAYKHHPRPKWLDANIAIVKKFYYNSSNLFILLKCRSFLVDLDVKIGIMGLYN